MTSAKTHLLKAIRCGDFTAFLGLADWCVENHDTRLAKPVNHFLETAQWHVTTKKKFRCGLAENLRRWLRDDLIAMLRLTKAWRLKGIHDVLGYSPSSRKNPMNVDDDLYEWQMKLARAALAHYRSLAPASTEVAGLDVASS